MLTLRSSEIFILNNKSLTFYENYSENLVLLILKVPFELHVPVELFIKLSVFVSKLHGKDGTNFQRKLI